MRFLALAVSDEAWFDAASHDAVNRALDAEARRTWELRSEGVVREMWWRSDRRDVVILLEAEDEPAARRLLETLPLVAAGALTFKVIGLSPYDGWERLFSGMDLVVERAVAWALEHVGSERYARRCLSFVEDAYEQPNGIEVFGGSTASESAAIYAASGAAAEAPRGAFVFFETTAAIDGEVLDWGHVGLSLGDGRIVHAWPRVRIDAIEAVASLPAGDWSPPRYAGWASPATILAGSRARIPAAASRDDRRATQ